jgi:F420-dependent methylenetetrahydromethanopterin dehydrogenase
MVDGKEVFNGLTDRSLGYVLVKCKPMVGSKVSIYLVDDSLADNKPQMVEMNGKNLDDGNSAALNAKGSLAIIEAEIYKSLIK